MSSLVVDEREKEETTVMKITRNVRPAVLGVAAVLALGLAGCSSAATNDPAPTTEPANGASDEAPADSSGYDSLPFKDILPLEDAALEGHDPITIGFSNTCYNVSWRVAMLESVEAEVARHDNVELIAVDGQCDNAKQMNSVQDLLTRGVDAVILSPMESQALVSAADMVREAGVPLIVLDRDVYTDKDVFIGQNNESTAYKLAQQMIEDLGGEGKLAVITGASGASASIDRQAGLKRALAEAPGIEVVAEGDGEWLPGPSQQLMQDWLVRFGPGGIDAVWTDAEDQAWGTLPAIKAADACEPKIKQYTIDGSKAALEDVKSGTFTGVGAYTPRIGDVAVRAAIKLILGEEIEGAKEYGQPGRWLELPDLPIATAENVDELLPSAWGDFEAPEDPCA